MTRAEKIEAFTIVLTNRLIAALAEPAPEVKPTGDGERCPACGATMSPARIFCDAYEFHRGPSPSTKEPAPRPAEEKDGP